jgi:hypothetical protein
MAKIRGRFCERELSHKALFARRSFRWVKRGRNWLLIGCPRGQWRERAKRCKTGTRAYKLLVASPGTGRCASGHVLRK